MADGFMRGSGPVSDAGIQFKVEGFFLLLLLFMESFGKLYPRRVDRANMAS